MADSTWFNALISDVWFGCFTTKRVWQKLHFLGSLVENAFGPRARIDSWCVHRKSESMVSPTSNTWVWVKHGVPNVSKCTILPNKLSFLCIQPLTHVGEFFGHAFALFGREQRGLPTSILPSCPTWCKECITFNRGNVLEDWKILQGYPRICRRYAKIWPCYSIAWCTSHLPRLPTSFWRWRHGDICWATSLGLPWTSASCPQFMDPYGSIWIHMDPVISGIGTSYTSWLQGVSNDCLRVKNPGGWAKTWRYQITR